MEHCMLCLNSEDKMVSSIRVNSIQWQTENIKYIIEKHIWPMDTKSSDTICIRCWKALDTFHRFYLLIENAHSTLKTTTKSKGLKKCIQNKCESYDCDKDTNDCKDYDENCAVETESLLQNSCPTQYAIEDENSLKKNEAKLFHYMTVKEKRTRGRPPKYVTNKITESYNDPLEKNLTSKSIIKRKHFKETSQENLKIVLEPILSCEKEESTIKTESVTASISIAADVLQGSNRTSSLDMEYRDFDYNKAPSEIYGKKRKNPDKKTREQHDKMIAEHLKISCSICDKPLDDFVALRKHFREEHQKRGFIICCKKKFFNRPILVDHLNFHLDPNYFKCKQCEKVYSDRSTLEKHTKIHLNDQKRLNHTCSECGKSFVGITQLKNHKFTHVTDYEKKFSCSECGKFFKTLYNLNYHVQAIHRNKYSKICDICGKTIRNSFKLHMEKHANRSTTNIHCDVCGLRLIDSRSLKQHKNSQHPIGGKKEYSCHICSKTSTSLRALRTHVRFIHEMDYTHKCKLCDKAFKRSEALKEHIATHTGTPLYTCPWCPKTFISNGNMYNHRKNAHPKTWEELKRKRYVDTVTNADFFKNACAEVIGNNIVKTRM